MKGEIKTRKPEIIKYFLVAGAIAYIAAYCVVAFFRLKYPFELMWQDGGAVDHVIRLLEGHKYYVAPSIDYVPSIYTPLFFYLSAALSKIIGVGFFPLRLISFLSSLGSFFVIFKIVKKETENAYFGIVAAGFFAATYHLSGSWFDLGRPDSLFLFILLVAIYLLRFYESSKYYVLAGILTSLSFMTKQTALVISLPLILYCILSDKRLAISFIIPIVVIIGGGSFALNYIHDGWFNYYVYELPRTTPKDLRSPLHFWLNDIIKPLSIASPIVVYYFISLFKNSKKKLLFYLLLTAGMMGASWYSRMRGGGYTNVLFPAYAVMAILFALGISELLKHSQIKFDRKSSLVKNSIYLICIIQFCYGSLLYNPFNQVPSGEDIKAGWEYIDKISKVEGEVFSPLHGYLNVMAGKKSYVNMMGMYDVITTNSEKHSAIKESLLDEIRVSMRDRKFAAVIIDSFEPWYPPDMEKYYMEEEQIFNDDNVFYPVTGMKTRPEFIYVPKDDS